MIRFNVLSRLLALGSLALVIGACGGKEKASPAAPAEVPAAAATKPAVPPAATKTNSVNAAYETLRKALVNDDFAAAKAAGKVLAEAAKGHDAATAAAAAKIADAADIAALRLEFGETSKAFIAMLEKMPGMAKGLHAFRCPMAIGYKKWVQPSDQIDNPYMGQRMLKCGGPTELKP